jgi:hypothetical protein
MPKTDVTVKHVVVFSKVNYPSLKEGACRLSF